MLCSTRLKFLMSGASFYSTSLLLRVFYTLAMLLWEDKDSFPSLSNASSRSDPDKSYVFRAVVKSSDYGSKMAECVAVLSRVY